MGESRRPWEHGRLERAGKPQLQGATSLFFRQSRAIARPGLTRQAVGRGPWCTVLGRPCGEPGRGWERESSQELMPPIPSPPASQVWVWRVLGTQASMAT